MQELNIIWDNLAKKELRNIYDFFKEKSIQGAESLKNDLINSTEKLKNTIVDYLIDPDLGKPYHCIIVRKRYRIVYRKVKNTIRIVYIFDTKQDRRKLKKIKENPS